MHHRSKRKVFDRKDGSSSIITTSISSLLQKLRTPSTFTLGKNPHLIKNKLHSKSTYFYRWGSKTKLSAKFSYVIPSVCTLALLVGGVIAINPETNIPSSKAYAESIDKFNTSVSHNAINTGQKEHTKSDTTHNVDINEVDMANKDVDFSGNIMLLTATPTISLTFNDNASFTTNATINDVSYISNIFTVNTSGLSGYTIKISAMNGSGTELHGRDNYAATIKPIANNTLPSAFTDDTWGYNIAEITSTNPNPDKTNLQYNAMPSYGTPKDIFTKNDLTGASNENQDYLLSFAAKFSAMSPSDHYIGNFQLSVTPQAFVPSTYHLNFNANNGDINSIPTNQSFTEEVLTASHEFTIPNITPTRNGYTFIGWSTESDSSTAQYGPGSKITIVKSSSVAITLYAIWSQNTVYTLNYNANNGIGAPSAQTHTEPGNSKATNHSFTTPSTKPTRTGYTFLGWSESNTATTADYQPNNSFTIQKTTPTKTLHAVWVKDTTYTINYDANGGSGAPSAQTHTEPGNSKATNHSFTIPSTKPTRTGYTFLGWGNNSSDTSKSYDTGSIITLQKNSPNKTLYAVWKINGPFNGITTMQAMTSSICNAANEGDEAILEDTRDNKKYYVTKLKDGNCWMTQNLAYNSGSSLAYSSWDVSTSSNGARYYAASHTNGNHSSVGNYYNLYAAQNACPSQWQLPTSNSTTANKSFGKLTAAYGIGSNAVGSTAMRNTPLYFIYGGTIGDGRISSSGSAGSYWSSTLHQDNFYYVLSFSDSKVNPSSNYANMHAGRSVRCVAK